MLTFRFILTLAVLATPLVCASCVCAQEPEPPALPLGGYLAKVGDQLNCYFTIEDRPVTGTQSFPWIRGITDFDPDFEVASIDALVANLNQELQGVDVVRSTKYPSVVHLMAEDLLQPGYVMDEHATTTYSGLLRGLPDHLGTLLDGKIKTREGGTIQEARAGLAGDSRTEVELAAQDDVVRDVLTGAVPLAGYKRLLWESGRFVPNDQAVYVRYFGRAPGPEDLISTVEDYLLEMGKRLNCYFTVEDRPDPNPEAHGLDPEFPYLLDRGVGHVDLEIATLDALVQHLDAELDGVTVTRSTKYPSVIHLIADDLVQPGYVMDDQVNVNYDGDLEFLANKLGMLLTGRIATAGLGDPPPDVGGHTRDVVVAEQNESVRNVLTGIGLSEDYWRLLWQSVQVVEQGSAKVYVRYHGSSYNQNGQLVDKDGNPLPGE